MNPFVRRAPAPTEESLGPVVNPDGTPTEVTLRMFGHDPFTCETGEDVEEDGMVRHVHVPEWRRRRLADPRGLRIAITDTTLLA